MERLEKLLSLPGVSGDEKEVRDALTLEYKQRKLEIIEDRLGSVFGKKNAGKDLNVMISANLDESGMMVSSINEDGSLEFLVIGFYEKKDLNQEKVILLGRRHEKLPGIIIKVDDKYIIEAGFSSAKEAQEKGVLIGNFVVVKNSYEEISDQKILSNNLSNRTGLDLGLSLLDNLKNKDLDYNLVVGGIAHSVVGQRGAITATTTVQPDLAIVLDFSYEKNIEKDAIYIRNFDKTMLPNQLLKNKLYDTAEAMNFKPRAHITDSPSDASFIHKSLSGTPTVVVVVPLKYEKAIHNILDMELMKNTEAFLSEFLSTLKEKDIKTMQYNRGNRYE